MKRVRKEFNPLQPSEDSTTSSPKEMRPGRARAAFRVVGMGGSAGGLEAFAQFFSEMRRETAFTIAFATRFTGKFSLLNE